MISGGFNCRSTLFVMILSFIVTQVAAQDWPQWRGPNRDGLVADFSPPASWPSELNLVWRVPVGPGLSSPVLVGGRIYLMTREGSEEVVTCFNADNGNILWQHRYNAPFLANPMAAGFQFPASRGKGPFATPAVADGRVITLGVTRALSCLDAESGELIWRKNYLEADAVDVAFYTCPLCGMDCDGERYEEPGKCPVSGCGLTLSPSFDDSETIQVIRGANYYGAAASPLIVDGIGVVHVGDDDRGFLIAFDPINGDELWRWEGPQAVGSSPIVAEIHGERQIVSFTRRALVGVSLDSGKLLWEYKIFSNSHITTPVIHGDNVIIGAYSGILASIKVTRQGEQWGAEREWASKFRINICTPVLRDGRAFGMSRTKLGMFYYIDADTGEILWTSKGRDGVYASMLDLGDSLLALTDRGRIFIVDKSDSAFTVRAQYQVAALDEDATQLAGEHWGPGVTVAETWAHPIVFDRSILIKEPGHLTLWSFEP